MSNNDTTGSAPKNAENDPPAANQPVEDSPDGSPPERLPESAHAAGRAANDPSVQQQGLVPETFQAPRGHPDGEVDTTPRRGGTRSAAYR